MQQQQQSSLSFATSRRRSRNNNVNVGAGATGNSNSNSNSTSSATGSTSTSTSNNNRNAAVVVVYFKTRICIKNVPYKLVVGSSTTQPPTTTTNAAKMKNSCTYSTNALRQFLLQRLSDYNSKNVHNDHDDDHDDGEEKESITITDCRIIASSSSKVRPPNNNNNNNHPTKAQPHHQLYYMAIIGFMNAQQASYAIQQLHRTYYQTTRLHVEYATLPSTSTLSKTTTRPTTTTTTTTTNITKTTTKATDHSETDHRIQNQQQQNIDQKKQEFLSIMGVTTERSTATPGTAAGTAIISLKKRPIWSNDDDHHHNQDSFNAHVEKDDDDDDDDASSSTTDTTDQEVVVDDDDDDDDDSNDDDDDDPMVDPLQHKKKVQPTTTKTTVSNSAMDFLRSKQVNATELQLPNDLDDRSDDANADIDVADEIGNANAATAVVAVVVESELDVVDKKKYDDVDTRNTTIKKDPNDDSNNIVNDDDDNSNSDNDVNDIDPKRLFIRNLPFNITEEDVRHHFQQYGTIVECHLCIDDQYRNKGYGFITYTEATAAYTAQIQCHGQDYHGRIIQIIPAHKKKNDDNNEQQQRKTRNTYKESMEEQRRLNAAAATTTTGSNTTDQNSWNTAHVRDDAVLDNLAVRLGLRNKSELFNVKDTLRSGDAAVRLALGETAIIDENRKFFQQHNIDMETLVSFHTDNGNNNNNNNTDGNKQESTTATTKIKRSTTSILVKNLPFDTSHDELKQLFIGNHVSILLAPSRTIAVIQYQHPNDAKISFRKLAYRRFKNVPLYLEWAPLAAVQKKPTATATTITNDTIVTPTTANTDAENLKTKNIDDEEEEQLLLGPTATLYVKNLNFRTTEEQLRNFFKHYDDSINPVLTVRIPQKVVTVKRDRSVDDPNIDHSQQQSMGYGFVEFRSPEIAKSILKKAQGAVLDDHALELRISSSSSSPAATATTSDQPIKKGKEKKIIVRNVPFQATRKELLQLFGSFGTLKKVRLPKKFDGSHRGYAFVEYVTAKDCAHAMQMLSKTHLYGRHLVLEYAAADEVVDDIEFLRTKAERDVLKRTTTTANGTGPRKNKKIRFD